MEPSRLILDELNTTSHRPLCCNCSISPIHIRAGVAALDCILADDNRILDNARYSIAAKALILARPEGFEPPATWFEGRHSIDRKLMIW
jgi:hypothetical protein